MVWLCLAFAYRLIKLMLGYKMHHTSVRLLVPHHRLVEGVQDGPGGLVLLLRLLQNCLQAVVVRAVVVLGPIGLLRLVRVDLTFPFAA